MLERQRTATTRVRTIYDNELGVTVIKGSCHCGNIFVTIERLPRSVTSCNCSVCYRLGAIWGYYHPEKVNIFSRTAPLAEYSWGKEHMLFFHCARCGCVTHYETTEASGNNWVGINFRMMNASLITTIPVRYFDGATTYKYIDE